MPNRIDATEFLDTVCGPLERLDAAALAGAVTVRWRARELCSLLRDSSQEVRRASALVLGLVGDAETVTFLARALHDDDSLVARTAEDSLWSVWFRLGNAQARPYFHRGIRALEDERHSEALEQLHKAVAVDREFAEAYNQLAMTCSLMERYRAAIRAARQAVRLMPAHFGALSCMGHCFTQLGELDRALICYRRAIRVNPRMHAIQEAIGRLETHVDRMSESKHGMVVSHLL